MSNPQSSPSGPSTFSTYVRLNIAKVGTAAKFFSERGAVVPNAAEVIRLALQLVVDIAGEEMGVEDARDWLAKARVGGVGGVRPVQVVQVDMPQAVEVVQQVEHVDIYTSAKSTAIRHRPTSQPLEPLDLRLGTDFNNDE